MLKDKERSSKLLFPIQKIKFPGDLSLIINLCQLLKNINPFDLETKRRDNFFLQYHNGKRSIQVIGISTIGKMPKLIVQFLKLSDAAEYTGHSFRSTSATIFADTGATTMDFQRHGG